MKEDPAVGGQGLPHIVAQAASEYLVGANFSFTSFGTPGHGAGPDLGALTTTAVKNPDGTYSITGSKIFITNGDQKLTENIIRPCPAADSRRKIQALKKSRDEMIQISEKSFGGL